MVETRQSSKLKHSLPENDDHAPASKRRNRRLVPNVPRSPGGIQEQQFSKASEATIFTVGHGTRTIFGLIELLGAAHVAKLVDVRSIPRSFTNPQFNRDVLASSYELQEADIEYLWLGAKLGGRRSAKQPNIEQHTAIRVAAFKNYAGYMSTPVFREGLDELKALAEASHGAKKGEVAIMCSETLWWRCHRRMIADALVAEGWEVRHLGVKKDEATKHELWDIARVDQSGELIYDVEQNGSHGRKDP